MGTSSPTMAFQQATLTVAVRLLTLASIPTARAERLASDCGNCCFASRKTCNGDAETRLELFLAGVMENAATLAAVTWYAIAGATDDERRLATPAQKPGTRGQDQDSEGSGFRDDAADIQEK